MLGGDSAGRNAGVRYVIPLRRHAFGQDIDNGCGTACCDTGSRSPRFPAVGRALLDAEIWALLRPVEPDDPQEGDLMRETRAALAELVAVADSLADP